MMLTSWRSTRGQAILLAFACAILAFAPAWCQAQEISHPMLRPPLTATAHFTGGSTESFELRLDDNGIIYVSVLVNGKPATFLLNGVWGIDALTEDAAKRLAIETKMDLDPSHPSAIIQHLQIGGFVIDNDPVTIQPTVGPMADGLLGFGFFSQAVVGIHWASRTMTLSDPARFSPPVGYTAVPITILEDRSASFAANIDGIDGRFLLSVGLNDGAVFYPGFVGRNRVRETFMSEEEAAAPAPESENRNGVVFHLASVSLDKPWVTIMRPDSQKPAEIAGRIGDRILERMDESIDYTHRQMYVLKNGIAARPVPEKPVPENVVAPSEKLNFAPIYVAVNKMPGELSPGATEQKRLLTDFQRQFTKLASDTGPVTAWSHFCTPDFTMRARLFGKAGQTITREQFMEALRKAKRPEDDSGDTSGLQLFSIFSSLRAIESGVRDDETKLTYAEPDKFESRGNEIVYTNSPVMTSSGKDTGIAKAVFEETFIKQGNGLLLKSVELVNLSLTAQGQEVPKELIEAMFAGDHGAALRAWMEQQLKDNLPTGK